MKTESSKFGKTVSHNGDDFVGPMPDTSGILNGSSTTGTSSKWDWVGDTVKDIVGIGTDYLNGLVNGKMVTPTPSVNAGNTSAPKDNTALYVGIGAGAMVFLVIILVLLKK